MNRAVDKKNAFRKSSTLLMIAGSLLSATFIAIGLNGLWQRHRVVSKQAKLPDQSVITKDVDEPEEGVPKEDTYIVPSDQPRRIVLNSIASEGLIQKVGVTDQNAIAVPTNVHYAGWFSQSVKPGDEGLSVIDGHVTGRYNDGIFRRLKDMRPGDVFSVEYGDKSIREFEVVETRTLPEADSIKFLMYKRQDIGRQLNLITCTGKYDDTRETFYDRVVVVSKSL